MKNLLKILVPFSIIIFLLSLISCGSLKKNIHKEKRDSTSVVDTKTITAIDTHTQNESEATRTITETFDTTIAGKVITGSLTVDTDHPRDTIYFQGNIKFTQTFDAIKKILKIYAECIQEPTRIFGNRRIEEKTKSKSSGESKTKQAATTHAKTEVHHELKQKDVERSPAWHWWMIFYLLGLFTKPILKFIYIGIKMIPWFSWLP